MFSLRGNRFTPITELVVMVLLYSDSLTWFLTAMVQFNWVKINAPLTCRNVPIFADNSVIFRQTSRNNIINLLNGRYRITLWTHYINIDCTNIHIYRRVNVESHITDIFRFFCRSKIRIVLYFI